MPYELTHIDPATLAQLRALMEVLTDNPVSRQWLTAEHLQELVADDHCHLIVAEDEGRIIGCATLCIYTSPTGCKGSVEDVVVLPEYQGRGIGRSLMQALLATAQQHTPITLMLTSRPHRTAARALYQSLGFEEKNTGVFKLKL